MLHVINCCNKSGNGLFNVPPTVVTTLSPFSVSPFNYFPGLVKTSQNWKKKFFLTHCSKHTHTPTHNYETIPPLPNKLTVLFSLCPAAPSIVPIMHQISSTMNSFTLSWPQPEQPNGIILDYELRFYEKVR